MTPDNGLKCSTCPSHCCGGSPVKPPILLPSEIETFSEYFMYKDGGVYRLKRKKDGECIFLNNRTCSIYEIRPMECRLYPWIFEWDGKNLSFILHDGCPSSKDAPPPFAPKEFWDKFAKIEI